MAAEIFSKDNCAYCTKAKNLLTSLNIDYTEHKIGRDLTREDFLAIFPNVKTVPQIMINGVYIGGYDDLLKWKEEVYGGYGEASL